MPLSCLLSTPFSLAYLGPGGALSSIGSVIALLAAILLALVGFIWYPLKRLLARRRQQERPPEDAAIGGKGEEDASA